MQGRALDTWVPPEGSWVLYSLWLFCNSGNVAVTVRTSKGKPLKMYCHAHIQVQALCIQKLSYILGLELCLGSLVPCSDSWQPVLSCSYIHLSFISRIISMVLIHPYVYT